MRLEIAVSVIIATLVAVACTGRNSWSPTQTPPATVPPATITPTPRPADEQRGIDVRPPDLTVSAGANSVTAGIGTFCWSHEGRGLCEDAVGVVTQVEPLTAVGQPTLVTNALDRTVKDVTARAWPARGLDLDDTLGMQSLSWPRAKLGDGRSLEAVAEENGLRVSTAGLEPGSHVIELFLFFEEGGDVSYGVFLELSAPES